MAGRQASITRSPIASIGPQYHRPTSNSTVCGWRQLGHKLRAERSRRCRACSRCKRACARRRPGPDCRTGSRPVSSTNVSSSARSASASDSAGAAATASRAPSRRSSAERPRARTSASGCALERRTQLAFRPWAGCDPQRGVERLGERRHAPGLEVDRALARQRAGADPTGPGRHCGFDPRPAVRRSRSCRSWRSSAASSSRRAPRRWRTRLGFTGLRRRRLSRRRSLSPPGFSVRSRPRGTAGRAQHHAGGRTRQRSQTSRARETGKPALRTAKSRHSAHPPPSPTPYGRDPRGSAAATPVPAGACLVDEVRWLRIRFPSLVGSKVPAILGRPPSPGATGPTLILRPYGFSWGT